MWKPEQLKYQLFTFVDMSAKSQNLASVFPSFRLGVLDPHQDLPIYIHPARSSRSDHTPRFGPRYKYNATIATPNAPSSCLYGTRVVRIQTPCGLYGGRRLLRRCEGEVRSAASARAPMSVGQVHAESKLAREFWEDMAERFCLDILAASDQSSFDSMTRSEQLRSSVE
jgi:hypothetical protein